MVEMRSSLPTGGARFSQTTHSFSTLRCTLPTAFLRYKGILSKITATGRGHSASETLYGRCRECLKTGAKMHIPFGEETLILTNPFWRRHLRRSPAARNRGNHKSLERLAKPLPKIRAVALDVAMTLERRYSSFRVRSTAEIDPLSRVRPRATSRTAVFRNVHSCYKLPFRDNQSRIQNEDRSTHGHIG